ncbi:MAG: hypothetical protein ABIV51_02890 [Saprospiraceae bacterium]
MNQNIFLVISMILLIPLIPAFLIYMVIKPNPDDIDISGPYGGLSLKLKGAFGGYFLLVIVGVTLFYFISNRDSGLTELQRQIALRDTTIMEMKSALAASANPVVDWHVKGLVLPSGLDGTKFFFDDGTTKSEPDGSFELVKRSIASQGVAKPPKWICVYNKTTGFNVISLNREVNHADIAKYGVIFNDTLHEIFIQKPLDINSILKDSSSAVANWVKGNPEIQQKVLQADPEFFKKMSDLQVTMLLPQSIIKERNDRKTQKVKTIHQ